MPAVTRRSLLAGAGATLLHSRTTGGRLQPGVLEDQPAHLALIAFDASAHPRATGRALVGWHAIARTLQARHRDDALTVTIGIGRSLLAAPGARAPVPGGMRPLPAFRGDALDPARSHGDACLQICAAHRAVVEHAERTLLAGAEGVFAVRWRQRGFVRRDVPRATPRNLLGFKDGTGNPSGRSAGPEIQAAGHGVPAWMRGGTFLVVRRIATDLGAWRRISVRRQEAIVGRHKRSGAPLGGLRERDHVNVALLRADAHVAVARADYGGTQAPAPLLRRSYGFCDDDASGLLFLAFARDLHAAYVPVQQRLADSDALGPFIEHRASAVFAIPPLHRSGVLVGELLRSGLAR